MRSESRWPYPMKRLFKFIVYLSFALPVSARSLPVFFEPNRGQCSPGVEFQARLAGGLLTLSSHRAELMGHRGSHVAMLLENSRVAASGEGEETLPGLLHYLGKATGVPTYGRVRYRDVYPGI